MTDKVEVVAFTEGPTEWLSVREMHKKKILNNDLGLEGSEKGNAKNYVVSDMKSLISKIRIGVPAAGILIVFDQEQRSSPREFVDEFGGEIDNLKLSQGIYENVFNGFFQDAAGVLPLSIHISNSPGPEPDANKDFDGYIIETINRSGINLIKNIRNQNPKWFRDYCKEDSCEFLNEIYMRSFPNLMRHDAGCPLLRSKSYLYSFISALQFNKAHVHLSQKICMLADDEVLKEVFSPLISAWDWLVENISTEESE